MSNNTAVVVAPPNAVEHAMTAVEMKAQVQRIQQVMRAVMKDKMHYGIIQGTPKPSLWKAGAEVLCATFHISPTYRVDDLSDGDCVRYRVTCVGAHQATGTILGEGMGEASSNEEKYRWRAAVCQEEFEETPEDRRRVKYKKFWDNEAREHVVDRVQQVRTEPADIANTVLKMACKRAQVAMALTVTAASDIFTQDLEDLPEGTDIGQQEPPPRQTRARGKPQTQAPRSNSSGATNANGQGTSGRCTERQAKLVGVKLDQAGILENDFLRHFGIAALGDLPFAQVNTALQWISDSVQ